MRLLFEGGYYSGCGFYSNKYGRHQGLDLLSTIVGVDERADMKVLRRSDLIKSTRTWTKRSCQVWQNHERVVDSVSQCKPAKPANK